MPIPESLAASLRGIFPAESFAFDEAARAAYAYDNSRRVALPDAVVFPTTHEQVVELVQACREAHVPLIARGRGTNTTGATVPDNGGIVASFERMQRILAIEPGDHIAIVEP
ncbi:MAG TPA: FAD-binding oxidoreductase, partial [Rhodanobacteraceae bacterium]